MSNKEAPRPGLLRAARDGKITNQEGSAALGVSIRQFRRLRRRLEAQGLAGLVHRSRGRRSPKQIAEPLRRRIARLIQGRYAGFNDCHLTQMLVLVDASEHRWCEDRAAVFTLVAAVDDATGAILALVVRPHEDLHGYAVLLRELIRTHGVPSMLYGDRTGIFVRRPRVMPSIALPGERRTGSPPPGPNHPWRTFRTSNPATAADTDKFTKQ